MADDQTGYGTSNFIVATAQPLKPLGDNGGPTQTMLPVPNGAAICAGDVALLPPGLDRDQRGFPRVTSLGGAPCVDAGAVQSVVPVPVLSETLFGLLAAALAIIGLRHVRRPRDLRR